jgi:hypothetical protein
MTAARPGHAECAGALEGALRILRIDLAAALEAASAGRFTLADEYLEASLSLIGNALAMYGQDAAPVMTDRMPPGNLVP